jgi:aminopeptidase N
MMLLLALFALSACSLGADNSDDPYALYRPALKAEYQRDFEGMDKAPRYYLTVTLTPTGELLMGTAEIEVTNYSPDPWRYLVFRLYPALQQYGGEMAIQSVAVDNQPTNFLYQAENTAVRINLATMMEPDERVRVRFNYRLLVPKWSDSSGVYALYGRSQQMITLPLFYPSLAVYQPDPALGSGAWWQDIGTSRGDASFNVASLFVVTATLPSEQVPIAPGTLVEATTNAQGQTRYVWVTGPVREFILHMSPNFASASAEAYGTRITTYWLPGHEAAGRAALQYAVGALRIYSDYFGPYPGREMSVAVAPLTYRGMEYPQVNLLGVELYTRFRDNMEILVAHEVAHQWWYQIVHNDPVNMPWLDEALAEYAVKLYYERLHGPREAALLERQRWQTPYDLLIAQDGDAPINRGVGSFEDGLHYETVIYGKGALLYSRIRQVLGDRRFQRFLREYLAEHRYQIVNTETWHEALDKLQLPELEQLFEEWVGDAAPITPTPEPDEDDGEGGGEDDSEDGGGERNGENGEVEEVAPDTI